MTWPAELWALGPLVVAAAVLPAIVLGLVAGLRFAEARRRPRAVRPWVEGVVATLLAPAAPYGCAQLLDATGPTPEAVYLVDSPEGRRLAAVTETYNQQGSTCRVFTWSLPEGRFVRGATARGTCEPSPDGAEVRRGHDARRALLAEGRFAPPLEEAVAASGPLPGSGQWRLLSHREGAAVVQLQDGTVREISLPPTPPARRLGATSRRPGPPVAGAHDPVRVASRCGCVGERCPTIVEYRDVAFGEGRRWIGRVAEGGNGGARLVWSRRTDTLFAAGGPLLEAVEDGDRCLLVAGRRGGHVELAWIDIDTGELARTARP